MTDRTTRNGLGDEGPPLSAIHAKQCESVYRVLASRRFSRIKPLNPAAVRDAIGVAIYHLAPVQLVGFWGVGHKSVAGAAEVETCAFLRKMAEEVKSAYPAGLRLHFIISTLHGYLNRITPETISSYIESLVPYFKENGFDYVLLDDIWEKYNVTWTAIEDVVSTQEPGWWAQVPARELMEKNSAAHGGSEGAVERAQKYYIMRTVEAPILAKEYVGNIFHTFSSPKLNHLFPDLPTLYFYAKPGWSNCPWFADQDESVTSR